MAEELAEVNKLLNVAEIQKLIPHRYPFLLIDRVLDFSPMEYIKGVKTVSALDPYLQGHFPDNPVMPGVLMVEALAQASAILGRISKGHECNTCLLTEISGSRFRRPVVPGDVLQLNVKLIRARKDFFWFEGVGSIGDEVAVESKFTAKLS